MLQHRPALKDLGKEFVVGVTDLVSGEKDPRNLMIIFSVLKAVMIEWDISEHAEVGMLDISNFFAILTLCSKCLIQSSATSQSHFALHRMIHME